MPRSPQWMDLYQSWFRVSSRGHNQLCGILLQSAHAFRFCEGSKFAISYWLGRSPLTQCWRYRAACDEHVYSPDGRKVKVCGFIWRPRWQVSRPQGAQTWITQFNLQTTSCLPLAFVCVHQMAPPRTVVTTSSCSLLLIYRPRKDARLS